MTAFEFASYDVLVAGVVFFTVLTALLLVKAFVARQLRRLVLAGRIPVLGYAEQILGATRLPFMLAVSLLASITQMDIPPDQRNWIHYAWIVILVSQIAMWGNRMITVAVERAFARQRETNPAAATHLMLAGLAGRIVLWSIALLVTLDNLGFNITTLMASLGIGGIAVALAVQNILGDVFSSVSIALDKPFVIGDFIVVDNYMGTVEYIGMKTTRLRSLGGEQVVFSNTELLKNRIRNFKRMQERRIAFEFGIAYETPVEEIERIPQLVRNIVTDDRFDTRFDRAHFKSYGDSALQFEVVYYVLNPDFNKYMDIQQEINLALLRAFRARGITFAYPTRTLHLAPAAELKPADEAPRRIARTAG